MKHLQYYIYLLIIIGFTACKSGVDPIEIEAMQTENQALQEIYENMKAKNTSISSDYEELKFQMLEQADAKGNRNLWLQDTFSIVQKDDEVSLIVARHSQLIQSFSELIQENKNWLNSLNTGNITTKEAQKTWLEKQVKADELIAQSDDELKVWENWKRTYEVWAREQTR